MVLISAARDYIARMLQDISGMKVLILDSQTVSSRSSPISLENQQNQQAYLNILFILILKSSPNWSQVSVVSVVFSQLELLQKEVSLVEMVDSTSKESMSHLKAVYFLRPTSENIQNLRRQLARPRFGEYHLCKLSLTFSSNINS